MKMVLILLVATGLAAGACGDGGGDGDGGGASGPVEVAAAFYPLYEAAVRVGGDAVRVTNLTPPGVEPHDLELTPDQVAAVEDADVVLFAGEGFQPAVEELASRHDGGFDVLEAAGAEGDAGDPHVWLDPVRMAGIVDGVARALTEAASPDAAATIADRARAYRDEVEALDREYREGLAGCERRVIVTTHEAFGWLVGRYDLTEHGVSGTSPEAEPSPGRLDELTRLVKAEGITTVFTETLAEDRAARALARETGARTAVLNPIEGLTEAQQDAGATYGSLMRENLAALRTALGCP